MNEVIKKCIDELSKESPSLDYVRGMLETALSMNQGIILPQTPYLPIFPDKPVVSNGDEAAIMDAKARAAIKTVQEMATTE